MHLTKNYSDPRIISDQPALTAAAAECAATARAVNYAINSSAGRLSREAQDSLSGIAHRIGRLLGTIKQDSHGNPEHWRVIAAVALQMEARAMGLDYASLVNDKPLTPD